MTIAYTATFFIEECCACGVLFGMSTEFTNERRSDHKTFYCPNGHAQSYQSESDKDRIQRLTGQLDQVRTRVASLVGERNGLRKDLDYSRRAQKATKTRMNKLKHRVAHGTCPCCKRTFKQLARHMETKHPAWIDQTDEKNI